jgi:peroxiredoxin
MSRKKLTALKAVLHLIFQSVVFAQAQTGEIVIGKPCPDFKLNSINYFSHSEASLKDFRGIWLVLDFFSAGCSSCFKNMPKMSQLNTVFRDSAQVFMIGYDDRNIRPAFENFRKKYDLSLPVVYDTGNLFTQFGVEGVPYIVVIDKQGIVRALTYSLTKENLEDFIQGREPEIARIQLTQASTYHYDNDKPLLQYGNGGPDSSFLFRSLLTQLKDRSINHQQGYISTVFKNKVQEAGVPLIHLYSLAYGDTVDDVPVFGKHRIPIPTNYGRFWQSPILELKDSSQFRYSFSSGKNLYAYSLMVPPERATAKFMKEVMQRDLQSYFGYRVSVESRMMPCWNLVANEEAKQKLPAKPGYKPKIIFPVYGGINLQNWGLDYLIFLIWMNFQEEPPFFDETGITGHIDLDLEADMTNFNEVRMALHKKGLDLIKGEREMQVIIIRDP